MPATFGCWRKAPLTHDKRIQNQYIGENYSPSASPDRRAYDAARKNSSIHRTQSAPTVQNKELYILSHCRASGKCVYAEREDHLGQYTYRHTSVPHRTNVSYPANVASRSERQFQSLYNQPHNSVGAVVSKATSIQNSNESSRNDPSFHQIYGPSLKFCNTSRTPSSVDTSHMMGDVDIERVPSFDAGNGIPKSLNQSVDSILANICILDTDTVNHNSVCSQLYQQELTKQIGTTQCVHFAGDAVAMTTGLTEATNLLATSSQPKSFKEDIRQMTAHSRRCSKMQPVYSSDRNSHMLSQYEEKTDYSQRRSGASQKQNYTTTKIDNGKLQIICPTDEQDIQQIFKGSKDLQMYSAQVSRQKQSKSRPTKYPQTSRKSNAPPRAPTYPLELNDAESRRAYSSLCTRSPTRRCRVDHTRRSQLGGRFENTEDHGEQISYNMSCAVRKDKNNDFILDLPVAELTAEWLRFRNAEEAGDWSPTGEEGVYADSPPMMRFLRFLKCQNASPGNFLRNAISRHPADFVRSKSHIDLTHTDVKSRQRTSTTTTSPEQMIGGSVHFQSRSLHPSFKNSPGLKTTHHPHPPPKLDVPRRKTLLPTLQFEHAAVITNQLCRAMLLQATQGQRKCSIPAHKSEKTSYSREFRESHPNERPRSVPVFRTKETWGELNAREYGSRPKQERYYQRGSSHRADECTDNVLDEITRPRENRTPKIIPLRGGRASTASDRPWCSTNQGETQTKYRKETYTCREGVPVAVFNFTECAATFQQYMHAGECGDDIECLCD